MFESNKVTDPLLPTWGNVHNAQLLSQCEEQDEGDSSLRRNDKYGLF